MATVKPVRDNIITFVYTPEKEDEISCAWARFKLDLERYSMSIESDCGNYCYTGWTPTPKTETFLHLCQRFNKGYLLEKFSNKTFVDNDKTFKNIKAFLYGNGFAADEGDYDEDKLEEICKAGRDADNLYDKICIYLNSTPVKEIPDLWEGIDCCIETDYPAGAKTIIDIYFKYIVPAIAEYCKTGEIYERNI